MKVVAWPCPAPGGTGEEFALIAGPKDAAARVLIVPALFDEANKTRRLMAETMRTLAGRGVASILPDLPGCGDSLAPLERQDLASWRKAVGAARKHFAATHVLTVRGGVLVAPARLRGWRFEPVGGASQLRTMLRARVISAREEGRQESIAKLLDHGRYAGLDLAGYPLSAPLVAGLELAELPKSSKHTILLLAELGGEALWRRAEPGEDSALANALAARIAGDVSP